MKNKLKILITTAKICPLFITDSSAFLQGVFKMNICYSFEIAQNEDYMS